MGLYAIDHAVTKDTVGLRFDNGQDERFVLKYDKENPNKAKSEFIAKLGPGDKVYLEAGSGAERFSIGCVRAGAEVFRVPGYLVHDELKAHGQKSDQTVGVLSDFALTKSELFYPFKEMEERIAEVAMLSRAYQIMQKRIRIPSIRRLEMSMQDLDLVEPLGKVDIDLYVQDKLAKVLIGYGIEREDAGTSTVAMLSSVLKGAEESFYALLQKALERTPIYGSLFKHITGCGPSISGRLIGEIEDISFFATPAKLMAYAGYDNLPDGSRTRRIVDSEIAKVLTERIHEACPGMTSPEIKERLKMSWTPDLKQAVWDFTDQIRGYGRPDNPWKRAYLHRYAYEEARQAKFDAKEPWERSFPRNRAMRWLGQKFLIHIWKRWRAINAGGEYAPPDFECLRD